MFDPGQVDQVVEALGLHGRRAVVDVGPGEAARDRSTVQKHPHRVAAHGGAQHQVHPPGAEVEVERAPLGGRRVQADAPAPVVGEFVGGRRRRAAEVVEARARGSGW